MALSLHMSYHLLKLLFSTICELMTTNDADKDAVLVLRNFLTNGLGSRIIAMMSADLDLSVRVNELLITYLFWLMNCCTNFRASRMSANWWSF